jgi:hypothetical protein
VEKTAWGTGASRTDWETPVPSSHTLYWVPAALTVVVPYHTTRPNFAEPHTLNYLPEPAAKYFLAPSPPAGSKCRKGDPSEITLSATDRGTGGARMSNLRPMPILLKSNYLTDCTVSQTMLFSHLCIFRRRGVPESLVLCALRDKSYA